MEVSTCLGLGSVGNLIKIAVYNQAGEVAAVLVSPQRALGIAVDLLEAVRRRSGPHVSG